MTGSKSLVLAAALSLGGCLSGQTGSADCAVPQACECRVLVGKQLAMVTVLDLTGQMVTLRVEEALNPNATLDLADVQTVLTGTANPTPYSCAPRAVPVRAGDSALALMSMNTVVTETGERRLELYTADLYPWANDVQLAGGETVPLDDLPALTRWAECDARFPPPKLKCDDTQVGCALVPPKAGHTRGGGWLVLLGLLLPLLRLARSTRRRFNKENPAR